MIMDVDRNGIASVVGTPGGPPASWANLLTRNRGPERPAEGSSPSSTENKLSSDEAESAQHTTKRRKLNSGSQSSPTSRARLQKFFETILITSGVTDRTTIDRVLGSLIEGGSGLEDQFWEAERGGELEGCLDSQGGQGDQKRDKGKGKANDS